MSFDPHASPHKILGIPANASTDQVRKAYKKLARRYHPDHNDAPDASARFMAVKAAHDEMLYRIASGYAPAPPPPRAARRSSRAPRGEARGGVQGAPRGSTWGGSTWGGPGSSSRGTSSRGARGGGAGSTSGATAGASGGASGATARASGGASGATAGASGGASGASGDAARSVSSAAGPGSPPTWEELLEQQHRAEASQSFWRLAMYSTGILFWFVAFSVLMLSLREMSDAMSAPREPPEVEEPPPEPPRDAGNQLW